VEGFGCGAASHNAGAQTGLGACHARELAAALLEPTLLLGELVGWTAAIHFPRFIVSRYSPAGA